MSIEVCVGSLYSAYKLSKDILWEIEYFRRLPRVERYVASTPVFKFLDQEWKVWLWPNYRPDYILVYLMRKGYPNTSLSRTAEFRLALRRRDGTDQTIETKVFSLEGGCNQWRNSLISYQLTRSLLDRDTETYLPSGHLTLALRLSVEGTEVSSEASSQTDTANNGQEASAKSTSEQNDETGTRNENEEDEVPNIKVLSTLAQNLNDLYISRNDYDVTIKVKKETFNAHRAILGARSPVLAAMFSHSMAESVSGEISMEDCDPKAFEIFLQFLYSGSLKKLTDENAMLVYYIADKYDVPELKEVCIDYMITSLSNDSICNVIELAARHEENRLLEKATDYFQEHATEIFPTSMWERFMVEKPTLAQDLIIGSLKYANAKSE